MRVEEFHYKIDWRTRASRPGHHPSQQRGGGMVFRYHVPLWQAPDPRRYDLRASLRDPFEQPLARVYTQTSAVAVYAVVDLSASIGFSGKLAVLADFIACLGYSAYRTGDAFGFVGCDKRVREDWLLAPSRSKTAGPELGRGLRQLAPAGRGSEGLVQACEWLSRRRALVFLVSDFHFPLALLERVMATLSHHDVVPVVLWDSTEYRDLPRFGVARLSDRETGRRRLLLLRPGLRARICARFEQRWQALEQLFNAYGRAPLRLEDRFEPEAVTKYFYFFQ